MANIGGARDPSREYWKDKHPNVAEPPLREIKIWCQLNYRFQGRKIRYPLAEVIFTSIHFFSGMPN
jgi:hypothetical protein